MSAFVRTTSSLKPSAYCHSCRRTTTQLNDPSWSHIISRFACLVSTRAQRPLPRCPRDPEQQSSKTIMIRLREVNGLFDHYYYMLRKAHRRARTRWGHMLVSFGQVGAHQLMLLNAPGRPDTFSLLCSSTPLHGWPPFSVVSLCTCPGPDAW